mgnify:CR=1 FL=1|jgi:hypothetical protein|tara:strand:- start:12884 stop:13438 length:555 start_codon:yes stop_codon:yes gene_type:complete
MSNYQFKTTNIRGKKYVEVNERIKYLRQEPTLKEYSILTEFTVLDSEMCVCKCTIATPQGKVVATGHAHEERASSNINKTSYVENCETSAVGRALAMLGIGIDTSIASANEVNEAIAKEQASPAAKKPAAKPAAKGNAPKDLMDKAVNFIKSSSNKQEAFDQITKKYGSDLTEKQMEGLKKFVR